MDGGGEKAWKTSRQQEQDERAGEDFVGRRLDKRRPKAYSHNLAID
jgi:hypothetical protein